MALKILTPDCEIHIEGFDTHYRSHMNWKLVNIVDSIENLIMYNNLYVGIAFKLDDKETTTLCCSIKKAIRDNNKMQITLQVNNPDEFIDVLNYRYGTLTPTDKSKQQLLDLLSGNYREEMKDESNAI